MSQFVNSTDNLSSYDEQGAAWYITVILLWYSTGLGLLVFLQMRPRTYENDFFLESSKKIRLSPSHRDPFAGYENIQADNVAKQILNELKDPVHRQRLWKIYYSSNQQQKEPDPQYYQTISADSATIGRINRKLATIHRMDICQREDALGLSTNSDTIKLFPKRFTCPRRSVEGSTQHQRSNLTSETSISRLETSSNRFKVEKVIENHKAIPISKGNPLVWNEI